MKIEKGLTAIVTGAASGIGQASAVSLAKRGANVVVADIDLDGAQATVSQIEQDGGSAIAISCDVGKDGEFENVRDETLAKFGSVQIVMNNAGIIPGGLPDHMPMEEWTRVLNVNLLSIVRSNSVFLPMLMEQRNGHIVNTASFAGLYTYSFDRQPYAASKAAIVQISEGLSLYLRPYDVGVTCLCPGPVKTNIARNQRRFGPPVDIWGPGPQFGLMSADEVGEQVVEAIENKRFMVPTHPAVRDLLVERASDWDRFLDHMAENPHVVMKMPPPDNAQ